jgi:hypothetical protein
MRMITIPHIQNRNLAGSSSRSWSLSSHSLSFGQLIACLIFSLGCSRVPAPVTTTARAPNAGYSPTPPKVNHAASHATNSVPLPERLMVDITTNAQSTMIGFMGTRPLPPWPRGNWFSFSFQRAGAVGEIDTWEDWRVVNIHTENLNEITRRLGTKTVEMVILPVTNYQSIRVEIPPPAPSTNNKTNLTVIERPVIHRTAYVVVTDTRIPREWFQFEPSWHNTIDPETARQIKAAYPASFRPTE